MLEAITQGFKAAKDRLVQGAVTSQALDAALRDIRLSLLEADVELEVAKSFLARVRGRANEEIIAGVARMETAAGVKEVTPYHRFVAICQEELEALMGPV